MGKKVIQSLDDDLKGYGAIPVNDYVGLSGDVQGLTTQMAEKALQTDLIITNANVTTNAAIIASKAYKMPTTMLQKIKNKIPFPNGWTWTTAPINIYRDGTGVLTTTLDASTFQHTGKVYYVNIATGNNSNDGLTSGTPLKSVYIAAQKSDVDIIECAAGTYYFGDAFNGIAIAKPITIRAATGADVKLLAAQALTWTKSIGYTNVYQATRSIVATVWDSSNLDTYGDYTKMVSVGSITLCDSTVNSFFYDTTNSILYVHTFNSRAADSSIIAFLDTQNFKIAGNYRCYLENIKLYGGNAGVAYPLAGSATDTEIFVAKGCEFKYSSNGNGGLQCLGYDVILQNCIAACNFADGFNYHIFDKVPHVIEVNCTARSSGIGTGALSDNASTIHDGGKIIRLNCVYYHCEGPNVADVGTGTESWVIGCESYGSVCTSATAANNSNYWTADGTMWMDSCIGYGSTTPYSVPSTGNLFMRNCLFDDAAPYITGKLQVY